jgi:hypothetical protein
MQDDGSSQPEGEVGAMLAKLVDRLGAELVEAGTVERSEFRDTECIGWDGPAALQSAIRSP